MMSDIFSAKKYLSKISSKIIPNDRILANIIKIKNLVLKAKKMNSRILLFGNGGSAAYEF